MTWTTFRQITRSSIIYGILRANRMVLRCRVLKSLNWSTFYLTSQIGWIFNVKWCAISIDLSESIHFPGTTNQSFVRNGIYIRVFVAYDRAQAIRAYKIPFKLDVIIKTGFVNQTISILFFLSAHNSTPFIQIPRYYCRIKEAHQHSILIKTIFCHAYHNAMIASYETFTIFVHMYSMHAMTFSKYWTLKISRSLSLSVSCSNELVFRA